MINVTRFSRGLPGGYLSSDMSDSPIGILPLLCLLFLWGLGSCAGGVLPSHPNEGHTGPEVQPMLLSTVLPGRELYTPWERGTFPGLHKEALYGLAGLSSDCSLARHHEML